ncbi:IS5/IS1182 family transposase, partial [Roseiarcaceae bacterium H3SJ34-1]|nr:IS5/IS1182 family transposase [Roseiarcaceae bacterium H3SJ34-1]
MGKDDLFGDLPIQAPGQPPGRAVDAGRPRLREPVRDQIELRAVDLEGLIGAEHPA